MEPKITSLLSIDLDDSRLRAASFQEPLALLRGVIEDLDRTPEKKRGLGWSTYLRIVFMAQRLAYIDSDKQYDAVLAAWAERQYGFVLQNSGDHIESLTGLGRSWLLKAQTSLARIEAHDSNSASQPATPGSTNTFRAMTGRDAENDRIDSADYVQARDMLRAAVEYFDRALVAAHRAKHFTGGLLELAAEAYMHLGNVTSPRSNERYYQRALHLLQRASDIDDYDMDEHLEEFLDQNVDYITDLPAPWYRT